MFTHALALFLSFVANILSSNSKIGNFVVKWLCFYNINQRFTTNFVEPGAIFCLIILIMARNVNSK